jgi:DNA repair exonuclease SbcCD ATPase subunit
MARIGLYKSDVKKARDALIAQSKNPSVDAVRVELGNTGSKTTIHKYLKELEEEDGAAGVGGKRASISDALQDLVERLAARLHDEAEERIAAIQKKSDTKASEHDAALLAAKLENSKMMTHVREVETALEQQDATLFNVRGELQRESTARQVAEQQVANLKERLNENEAHRLSIEEKHQHARDALEHYRESVKEQRDQDQRRHEQQIQQMQAEMRQLQQGLIVKQDDVTRLNQEGARLVADLSHAQNALYEQQARGRQLEHKLQALQAVEQHALAVEARLADREIQLQAQKEQLEASSIKSQALMDQVRELELAGAVAEAKLAAQQQAMAELRAYLDARGPAKHTHS